MCSELLPPRFFAWRDDFFSGRVMRLQAPGARLQAEVPGQGNVEKLIAALYRKA
jgi:hypothetical protein